MKVRGKKHGSQMIGLLLALVLLLSACGTAAPQEEKKKAEERPTLRWLTTGDAAAKPIEENDRVIQAIEDKLGIDLVVEVVPAAGYCHWCFWHQRHPAMGERRYGHCFGRLFSGRTGFEKKTG